jgi:nicotinamide mononucleotide transporter
MQWNDIWSDITEYFIQINAWELTGLLTGVLAVVFLIRQQMVNWAFGIAYVLVSFVVFWEARLYGDFILHIVFLMLNIYGWWHWSRGGDREEQLFVSRLELGPALRIFFVTGLLIFVFAQFLIALPTWFEGVAPASLPYWDSTTSMLSVTGIWLQARKKIDNWYYWILVDILATGIYFYKGIYFYALLYLIYIGLAVVGYLAWKKTLTE